MVAASSEASKLNITGLSFSTAETLPLLSFVQQPYETYVYNRTNSKQGAHIVLAEELCSFSRLHLITSEG